MLPVLGPRLFLLPLLLLLLLLLASLDPQMKARSAARLERAVPDDGGRLPGVGGGCGGGETKSAIREQQQIKPFK